MRLVLAGAGHVHIKTLENLKEFTRRGWSVDVVSPAPFHYYSGMGPGLLGGDYGPEEVRFPVREMTESRNCSFREDRLVAIEADSNRLRLESGATLNYDLLSCNLGSHVNAEGLEISSEVPEDFFFPVKPIENLYEAHKRLLELPIRGSGGVLIVGGGPAAVEIAGNSIELLSRRSRESGSEAPSVCLCAGGEFLRHFPERLRKICRRSLESRGAGIRRGYISKILPTGVECADGSRMEASMVILATGVKPPAWLRDTGIALGDDGGILVNEHLQSVSHPNIFAGGDCLSFKPTPIRRVGVHAVRQAPVLLENLLAFVEGRGTGARGRTVSGAESPGARRSGLPGRFSPQNQFLLILNLGGGRGVAAKWGTTFDGRLAFKLKDRIDRQFVGSVRPDGG